MKNGAASDGGIWHILCTLEYLISVQIKVSHSNRMLSIQIDTKIFNRSYVQQHQIALLCKQYETELFKLDLYGY